MPQRVLCDGSLRVTLQRMGERLLLTVTDGSQAGFLTDAATVADALRGAPLQLSSPEGYCHIEARGETVFLTLSLHGEGRQTCSIPTREFADALS